SPPLFVGIAGWWAARVARCPFVLDIRDLWPESAAGVGALDDGPAMRAGHALARGLYKSASTIIATSHGIANRITPDLPGAPPLEVIYNGAHADYFAPPSSRSSHFEWERKDGIVALYAGNFGLAQGLETIVDVAQRLRPRRDVSIVLLGDGIARESLQARAAS